MPLGGRIFDGTFWWSRFGKIIWCLVGILLYRFCPESDNRVERACVSERCFFALVQHQKIPTLELHLCIQWGCTNWLWRITFLQNPFFTFFANWTDSMTGLQWLFLPTKIYLSSLPDTGRFQINLLWTTLDSWKHPESSRKGNQSCHSVNLLGKPVATCARVNDTNQWESRCMVE